MSSQSIEDNRVFDLNQSLSPKSKKVFIRIKQIDSLNEVLIFLINNSDEVISIPSINGLPSFNREFEIKEGKWKAINPNPKASCATGYGYTLLKPNQYTYLKKKLSCTGDFETKIRFGVKIKEEQWIYSPPIITRIDEDYFSLPDYIGIMDQINESLCGKELTNKEKIEIKLVKAKVLSLKDKDYIKAVKECREIRETYGDSDEIRIELGRIYVRSLGKYSNESQITKQAIISAAFEEWGKINSPTNLAKKFELESRYSEFLPTKQELLSSELQCKSIKEEVIECYVPLIVDQKIEMILKQN